MRKAFFIFFFLIPLLVSADQSVRVKIQSVDLDNRNIVVMLPGEDQKWLLHYKRGCTGLTKDSATIDLITDDELDARKDSLKLGLYDRCDIDQAEEINTIFTVDSTFPSGTESILADEKGVRFSILHGRGCEPIRSFIHGKIYADVSGKTIQEGDRIYFPRNAGVCTAGFSRPVENVLTVEKGKDFAQPGVISDLAAAPADRAVELSWKKARDSEDVDYYWVSYDSSPLKTKDYELADMPNRQKAFTNFYKVTGLDNDSSYYFYVIAVDRKGHAASGWSNAAKATPTASAFRPSEIPQGNTSLNFRIKKETDLSFVFEWDILPRATRYLVALEMDGRRDWILQGVRSTAYVNKTPARKGKDLRLLVRAFNRYGVLDEVYFNFKF